MSSHDDKAWEAADMDNRLSVQVMIWKNSAEFEVSIVSFEEAKLLAADPTRYHIEPLSDELAWATQWDVIQGDVMTLPDAEEYISAGWRYYWELVDWYAWENDLVNTVQVHRTSRMGMQVGEIMCGWLLLMDSKYNQQDD